MTEKNFHFFVRVTREFKRFNNTEYGVIILPRKREENHGERPSRKLRHVALRHRFIYHGCVRVMLKNHKKSLFARSGLKKMAENRHFSVRVFIK